MELDKIYCEDCFDGLQRIPSGIVDLIYTDPPYVVSKSSGGTVNNLKKLNVSLAQLDGAQLREGYEIERFAEEVKRLQGDRICIYLWCNKAQIPEYFRTYVERLKCRFDVLCWHKRNALPTYANKYLSDTEYCLYFHRGGRTHPANYTDAQTFDVGLINHADKKRYNHPTIKPLDIVRRHIRNSSAPDAVVLDPFLGSGTTAVACIKEHRHYIGFERNIEFFSVAARRIREELTASALYVI